MSAFKLTEAEYAIVSAAGVYKTVPLAERHGLLYVAVAGGYVSLRADASTSKDKLRLVELSWEGELHATKLGKLCLPTVKGSEPIADDKKEQLLLGAVSYTHLTLPTKA